MAEIREAVNENNYDVVSIHNGAVYLANSHTDGVNRVVFWLKDIQKIEAKKFVPYCNSPEVMYVLRVSGYGYDITGEVFETIMSVMMGGEEIKKKPDWTDDELYEYARLLNDWIEATDSERADRQGATGYVHSWFELDKRWNDFVSEHHDFDVITIPMCSRTQLAAELIRVRGLIE